MFGRGKLDRGRLSLLFLAAIAVPAVAVSTAAFRGLAQERVRVEQELRARKQAEAVRAAEALEAFLRRLIDSLEPLPAGAAVIETRDGEVTVRPQGVLAYHPGREPLPAVPPSNLEQAQRLELRDRRWEAALAEYRAARATHPQWSLFLQARLLRKMDRKAEALRAWQELARLPEIRLGSLPSQFLARFESGYPGLLDAMETGRWPLSGAQFHYYREVLGGAARPRPPNLVLADDIAAFLRSPAAQLPSGTLAWWTPTGSGVRAAFLPPAVLRENVWPWLSNSRLRLAEDGHGEPVRLLPSTWRVAALDVAEPELAAFDRQQNWLRALLALLLLAGSAGALFLYRAMRREMEIAALQAEFVAAVSHEFRSPLAGIRQLVHLLERDRAPDENRRREYYAMMGRECARLSRLVENVLDFSRMENGSRQYRFDSIDTAEFLGELADDFRQSHPAVDVSIPAILPAIRADREALATAVRNILDNAWKYAGNAHLEAQSCGGRVEIRVRDTGPGIPPEEREKIFEKFYRVGGDSARRVKGVGLGLALVKRIVEAHGGIVRVESEVGRGSVFTVDLEALP